jgi:hypothetical protein
MEETYEIYYFANQYAGTYLDGFANLSKAEEYLRTKHSDYVKQQGKEVVLPPYIVIAKVSKTEQKIENTFYVKK